jgi:hypothetical protein
MAKTAYGAVGRFLAQALKVATHHEDNRPLKLVDYADLALEAAQRI